MSMQPETPPELDIAAETFDPDDQSTWNVHVGDTYTEGLKNWTISTINVDDGSCTFDPIFGDFPFDPVDNQTFSIGSRNFRYDAALGTWVPETESIRKMHDLQALLDQLPTEDPQDGSWWIDTGVLTKSSLPT